MIEERPAAPGAGLSRNFGSPSAPGEAVERDLERFIEKRDSQRRQTEGEYDQEAVWRESTRRYNAARAEQMREAWSQYHREQAERHRGILEALVAHHEQRAEELMNGISRGAA